MPWLYGDQDGDNQDDDEDVIDLSQLFGDDGDIESGVTSGADPTNWDPIEVGQEK